MTPPHKRSLGRPVQQPDALATSEQILRSASLLFMEKGYTSVSMNQVAEHCGITKASVYYYYPTKQDLFVASVATTLARVNGRIRKLLQEPGTFRERLLQITINYLRVPQVHMDEMFRSIQHHLSGEQQETLIRHENDLYETLRKGFAQATEQGEIVCDDPNLVAHLYVSMLRVGERQYADKNKLFPSAEQAAEAIVAFLWRGIHI
ncbi:TetR family transcriptional regulator [Paenibacillus sp. HMSSN-139]|nr:TetR family transcriptional regulator [Paenibacillus sp. HMSSN-139]